MHVCPMVTPGTPPIPHVGGPIIGPGAPTVLICNMPAAVMGDMCTCVGPPSTIVLGSMGVMIMNKPAARMGDLCAHGGSIMTGAPTVFIGEMSPGAAGAGVLSGIMSAIGKSLQGVFDLLEGALDDQAPKGMMAVVAQAMANGLGNGAPGNGMGILGKAMAQSILAIAGTLRTESPMQGMMGRIAHIIGATNAMNQAAERGDAYSSTGGRDEPPAVPEEDGPHAERDPEQVDHVPQEVNGPHGSDGRSAQDPFME